MKNFFIKFLAVVVFLLAIVIVPLIVIPPDNDGYLLEYNNKTELLKDVPSPRIIVIGGSSVAFSTDSKMIQDSLKTNVINFGLHGGIGIRYPMEDALQYVNDGDIVLLQIEYANFFNGGNGESTTMSQFMSAIGWDNIWKLNFFQLKNVILGTTEQSFHRIVSLKNQGEKSGRFYYKKSGFNEFGDEISHYNYEDEMQERYTQPNTQKVNHSFMRWLDEIIKSYEKRGATVYMLPPVCSKGAFKAMYNNSISKELGIIDRQYIVAPQSMVLDDSCFFNSRYHANKIGTYQNSLNIINALRTKKK